MSESWADLEAALGEVGEICLSDRALDVRKELLQKYVGRSFGRSNHLGLEVESVDFLKVADDGNMQVDTRSYGHSRKITVPNLGLSAKVREWGNR